MQGTNMIDVVGLTRNIDAVSATLDIDLAALLAATSPKERHALRISVERCTLELQRLLYQLVTLPFVGDAAL